MSFAWKVSKMDFLHSHIYGSHMGTYEKNIKNSAQRSIVTTVSMQWKFPSNGSNLFILQHKYGTTFKLIYSNIALFLNSFLWQHHIIKMSVFITYSALPRKNIFVVAMATANFITLWYFKIIKNVVNSSCYVVLLPT